MRYHQLILIGVLGCFALLGTSCKKDIEIDYHQVDPIYVVEASVSNDGMETRISETNNMDDNSTQSDIDRAKVVVTGSDGSTNTLTYTRNGFYKSTAKGTPGVEYTIDITFDNNHFTSSSIMQNMPKMNSFRFIRKKIVTENYQMGELMLQDIPNEDNWYFMHIYRNGTGYRWAVKRDDQNPNSELQQLFSFAREGSNDEDLLKDGDRLHIEIRAIDQKSYDYL
jgi:hypothetical protein